MEAKDKCTVLLNLLFHFSLKMRLIELIYVTLMLIVINNSTRVTSNSECETTEKSKSGNYHENE